MIDIPKNYYSSLSCYEEFVLRTNLLGYDIHDEVVLRSLTKVNDVDPYFWFIIGEEGDRHICIIDEHGDKVENVVLNGDFDCSFSDIDSLQGAPREVGGNFGCSGCQSLTSLQGAPKKVGKNFSCSHCESLTSLKGASKEVGADFGCIGCNSLTSLESAIIEVGKNFSCSHCSSLTTLYGSPEKVGGNFWCMYCSSLKSLDGITKNIGGEIYSTYRCLKIFR